jgi:hypothetical protein
MLTHGNGLPAATLQCRRRETGSRLGHYAAALGICACSLLAAACGTLNPEPVERPTKPIPEISGGQSRDSAEPRIPDGARVFEIDPGQSVVTILVYRAGPLAGFGHNHVVTSGQETGFAWQGRVPAGSGFEIHVPVAALVVDDPAARAAIGAEFAGEIPEAAREGTYANMMRPELLAVATFPEVIVRCGGLAGTWERPVAVAELTARGSFRIRQSDFGITPFSVAGGAIQVGDELRVGFDIVARLRP